MSAVGACSNLRCMDLWLLRLLNTCTSRTLLVRPGLASASLQLQCVFSRPPLELGSSFSRYLSGLRLAVGAPSKYYTRFSLPSGHLHHLVVPKCRHGRLGQTRGVNRCMSMCTAEPIISASSGGHRNPLRGCSGLILASELNDLFVTGLFGAQRWRPHLQKAKHSWKLLHHTYVFLPSSHLSSSRTPRSAHLSRAQPSLLRNISRSARAGDLTFESIREMFWLSS